MKRTSIISNSLIFYHKYYIFKLFTNSHIINKLNENNLNNIELAYICIACFFISIKSSNFLMQIEYILEIIDKNKILDISESNKLKIKEIVLNYETDILFSIGFNLEHSLPYNLIKILWGNLSNKILEFININKNNKNINLNYIINNGDEASIMKTIKESIIEIITYSFLFPFFLYYNSSIIALSCLKIALNKFNIKINIIDIISNHKEMEFISIDDIEVCSSLIDEVIISTNKKINNETQINNINNINIQNLISINHNTAQNNELKKKISDISISNDVFFSKKQK